MCNYNNFRKVNSGEENASSHRRLGINSGFHQITRARKSKKDKKIKFGNTKAKPWEKASS